MASTWNSIKGTAPKNEYNFWSKNSSPEKGTQIQAHTHTKRSEKTAECLLAFFLSLSLVYLCVLKITSLFFFVFHFAFGTHSIENSALYAPDFVRVSSGEHFMCKTCWMGQLFNVWVCAAVFAWILSRKIYMYTYNTLWYKCDGRLRKKHSTTNSSMMCCTGAGGVVRCKWQWHQCGRIFGIHFWQRICVFIFKAQTLLTLG